MDEGSLLQTAVEGGAAPSTLILVLWVLIERRFAQLKAKLGAYKLRTEHRLTRCESKLNLSPVPAPEEEAG